MSIDHVKRARDAWPILVRLARSGGEPMTYGQLCARMGLHHRAAGYFLGVIQRYCARKKLPALQALAVNKRTGIPGAGYAGARAQKSHAKEVERVRAHTWALLAPRFDE